MTTPHIQTFIKYFGVNQYNNVTLLNTIYERGREGKKEREERGERENVSDKATFYVTLF